MREFQTDISTPDGSMNAVVIHPEEGGPFPVAVCYMDSCGIRPDFLTLARGLAVAGYFVVTPNAYYRRAREVDLDPDRIGSEDPTYEDGRALMWELNRSITVAGFEDDVRATLAWIEAQPEAMPGPVGVYGYCLGGRLAMTAAAALPERIAAAASFHGAGFVQDDLSKAGDIRAEVYFAHAGTDKYVPLDRIEAIEARLADAGVLHRFEIYQEAHHGFTIPGRQTYHQPSADRAWERLFNLFRRNLPQAAPGAPSRLYRGLARI